MDPGRSGNIAFLTGLRGLAALFVLMSHVWYQVWPAVPAPYGYGRRPQGGIALLTDWLYYGHFGVVVFIVLSGFCLMLPVIANGNTLQGGVSGFLRRRARRILPPYYAALALALIAISVWLGRRTGSQWDISLPVTARGIMSHVLMLQDFVDPTQINYVFWSIAAEAHLYLLFPLFVWGFRRLGPVRATMSVYGIVFAIIALLELIGYHDIPPQFIGLCAHFVLGMMCATLYARPDGPRMPWGRVSLALALLLAALCAAWGTDASERRFALLDSLCATGTFALIMAAAREGPGNRARALLESPPIINIGGFSYSLYLVHAPVLQAVWQYALVPRGAGEGETFLALMALGVPASMVVAYGIFLVCERPFLVARGHAAWLVRSP